VETGDSPVVVVEYGAGDAVELAAGGGPAEQVAPALDALAGRPQPGCADEGFVRGGAPAAQVLSSGIVGVGGADLVAGATGVVVELEVGVREQRWAPGGGAGFSVSGPGEPAGCRPGRAVGKRRGR
jgi:hypothetical protein